MSIKAVVINGTGGSGKDQFVEFCQELLNVNSKQIVFNISSIDPVKEALIAEGLWKKGKPKTPEIRNLMSERKAEVGADFINQYLLDKMKKIEETYGTATLVFVHIREPENITAFRQLCENKGIETDALHISRPGVFVTGNRSDEETALYEDYTFHIINDGSLEDLKATADLFLVENKIKPTLDPEVRGEFKLYTGNPPIDEAHNPEIAT